MISFDNLSSEQIDIINYDGNIAVLACPGSGKSTTISFKIKNILMQIPNYKGIIAISYTNKASDELEAKVETLINDPENSFFGTIDKFCINEIIVPATFKNNKKIEILGNDFYNDSKKTLSEIELMDKQRKIINEGKIILKLVGKYSLELLKSNKIIQEYLISRYSAIFIDEYQDCDEYQDSIFRFLVELGMKGIAVGDPEQSIFEYANKSSIYLRSLGKYGFKVFQLNTNRRCHKSIVDYATKFISSEYACVAEDDIRIGRHKIIGDEEKVANFIDLKLESIMKKYEIKDLSEIAILCRSNRTGKLIKQHLQCESVFFEETSLEKLANYYQEARLAIELIKYYFSKTKKTSDDIVLSFSPYNTVKSKRAKMTSLIKKMKEKQNLFEIIDVMKMIIQCDVSQEIKNEVGQVIKSKKLLDNLLFNNNGKLSIMSIHKSKGLEFDFVILVDLHNYILPSKKKECENEDINLHYVSITRARKYVLMLVNTIRTKSDGVKILSDVSDFISQRDDLLFLKKGNI